MRDKVTVSEDRAIGRTEARVVIVLEDGRRLERHVPHALGTLERPMSNADLEAKFRALTEGILPEARAAELIAACWSLEPLPDAGEVARLAAA